MSCASGCSTVGEMVRRIAVQLRDFESGYEHVRWHPETLVSYIHEALCEISQHRPDAFVKTTQLQLKPGVHQSLPSKYAQLINIEGNAVTSPDGSTTITSSVRKDSASPWRDIYKAAHCAPACGSDAYCASASGQFEIKSYANNPVDDSVFTVYPAVPVGASASVQATVIAKPVKPCATNMGACLDIPCKYEAQIMDWALHRAYGADFESNYNSQASSRHLKAFYDALGVKRLAESLFNQETAEGEPVPSSHQQRRLATTNR